MACCGPDKKKREASEAREGHQQHAGSSMSCCGGRMGYVWIALLVVLLLLVLLGR